MKKKIGLRFLLIIVVITFGFFFVFNKSAFAQGTFNCLIRHDGVCMSKDNNCSTGYSPTDCSVWRGKPQECQTPHLCVDSAKASTCIAKYASMTCPSNFPIDCSGIYQCCKTQGDCTTIYGGCDPGTGNGNDGMKTAIGCLPIYNLNEFIKWVVLIVVPIASGIAFLLMISGAFQIISSSGDPKKVQSGKELITSAFSGLLFIILTIFLLKLLGVDILHIPGFSK